MTVTYTTSRHLWMLRTILEKFTGLLPTTEKNVMPSSLSFTTCICHQSPTLALKQVLEGLPWLQCHPVGLAIYWGFPFSFSGEIKIHVAKLSEPSFYDFKAGRIHRSSETFVRWQCVVFLNPCWHLQFASQTLATRMLHFGNRCSPISLLGLSTWSHYAEKGHISLNLAFGPGLLKWIDAPRQASQQLCSSFMYSLVGPEPIAWLTQKPRVVGYS